MVFLDFFSNNRRERLPRRRRRRRLKFLPILSLLGITIFVSRIFITFTSFEMPSTYLDASAPLELSKLDSSKVQSPNPAPTKATSHIINGWQRIKPSHDVTVYGEIELFHVGKSCRWQPTRFYFPKKLLSWILFFSRANFLGKWICRDCGQESLFASWESCPVLQPRGKCPEFEYQRWEEPRPRSSSTYDPFASAPYPVRLITSYGVGTVRKVEYEQPQCLSLKKPCFDMDRCTFPSKSTSGTTVSERQLIRPIPIFAYPGQAQTDLKYAIGEGTIVSSDTPVNSVFPTTSIHIVEDPQMACLLIAHADDLDDAKVSASWDMGINHYIYGVTKPISENVHYGMAALGSVAITEAQLRPEFDIPLPLPAIWKVRDLFERKPDFHREIEDLHRPRKYLLAFKGSIQDTLQPYYQHRWLAAEYLYEETGVAIDVQCKHKTLWGDTVTFAHYDDPSQDNFDELMVNSTFAFCPGGSHVTSFRFTEVLSAGAIPVLLPEIVTPFYPEADWSGCVIRVSQARIVDLPHILRSIPTEEVRKRQVQCQRLHRVFLYAHDYDTDQDVVDKETKLPTTSGYLAAALKVWYLRLEKQHHSNQLDKLLSLSTDT